MTRTTARRRSAQVERGPEPTQANTGTEARSHSNDNGPHDPNPLVSDAISRITTLFRTIANEIEDLGIQLAKPADQSVHADVPHSNDTIAPGRMLTVGDLAGVLQVDERTVRRWRDEGKLPDAIELGGVIRWHPDTVAKVGCWNRKSYSAVDISLNESNVCTANRCATSSGV